MMPSPRPRSTRQARAGLEFGLGTVARANLAVAAWRWRYELLGMASLAVIWTTLGVGDAAALTPGLGALLGGTSSPPGGRRGPAPPPSCICHAHRRRVGRAHASLHARDGTM